VLRSEKAAVVERLHELFQGSPHVIVTSFRGLTVNQDGELRRQIDRVGGSYRVIKNRLARRAVAGTAAEELGPRFLGPCGVATHATDPVALAKVLAEFAKANPQLEMVAGVVDAKDVLDAAGVERLSKLPGLLELRAQLLALIQTPATTLLRLLNTPGGQIARALNARCEKEGGAES